MSPSRIKLAVALSYNQGDDIAPRIIAKGSNNIAEKILEIAKNHNIHVHKDHQLASTLAAFEIDELIPIEAYQAVAEILSYIYKRYQPQSLAL